MANDKLNAISQELSRVLLPVASDLSLVGESLYDSVMPSASIHEPFLHLERTKGKLLRPAIVLLVGGMFGPITATHRTAAQAVELIHVASLIHDDVVDHSDLRRGMPSLNAKFGEETALLAGDYLFGKAIELLSCYGDARPYSIVAKFISNASAGEILQQRNAFSPDATEDQYLAYIEAKTARLFELAAVLGAYASTATDVEIEAVADFGLNFGFAFQVADDCADLLSDEYLEGKPIHQDCLAGQFTLPFIRLFEINGRKWAEGWISELKRNPQTALEDAIRQIVEKKAMEYCLDRADEYLIRAKAAVEGREIGKKGASLVSLGAVVLAKMRHLVEVR